MSSRSSKSTNGMKTNGHTKPKIVSLRNLSDHSTQIRSAVGVDDPLFQSFPSEVFFHDFEAFSVHEATITLRNKDLVGRRVQLEPPASHFFSLSAPQRGHNARNKVAPGMEVLYTLTFKPESSGDYHCDLICTTEREQFVIPVRARGDRAKLDYPSRIEFPCAPVKFPSTHPFLLRNYGPRATSFSLTPPTGYTVSPSEGFIEVGDCINVALVFTPVCEGRFAGELWINLDDGVRMSALVSGEGKNVDVKLEASQLECLSTYIQLSSVKTVLLFNHSEIPIQFSWRNNKTEQEEIQLKQQLRELALAEETERMNIDAVMDTMDEDSVDEDAMSEPSDEGDQQNFRRLRAEQAVTRKYRKLRQELEEQNMSFQHEHFSLEPLMGEIYPNGQKEITVTFTPKAVTHYFTPAYCEVTGATERLPLQLSGQGIGPKAVFGYETLDVADVYVNAVHRYEVTLQNVGEIAAEYQLIQPKEPSRFSFVPDRGVLAVGDEGEEVKIAITFTSDTLGEFVETLEWSLQGTSKPMLLTFKGNVIGPTFYFDEQVLDFGLTSYGFLNSQPLTLHNTSEIPMKYVLRIPEDGKFMEREFGITPNTGNIFPGEKTHIKVDFIPETVKRYDNYQLVIDIHGVGQALVTIPIVAECQVSDVIVETDTLDFGEVFLRHPVTQFIPMRNLSEVLHTKFEVLPQDEASEEVATILPERPIAAIAPNSSHNLNITLTAHRLGIVNFPAFIKVPGRGVPPKVVTVKSTVVGPKVTLERESLDWGKAFVLRDMPMPLTLTNESPIPAEFKAFVHKKGSCFSVDPPQGRMKPFESITLTVTANLNEILRIQDILHILIHEGADLQVKLAARGVGTTIHSSTNIERIDHGDQFTSTITKSGFRLENHGRRAQTLVWNFVPPEEENDPKAASKRRKNKKDDVELPPCVFTINPRKTVLEPMMAMDFTVQGSCSKAGPVDEQWICGALIGKEAKEYVDIYTCRVVANFVDPLIEFSRTDISFQQMNDPKNPVPAQEERLSIKNISSLPLVFWMKVPEPFTIDTLEHTLAPGEEASASINFVPPNTGDKQSEKIKSNLVIHYSDHPQRDKLPLFGEICYPNLSFESTKIDFGCILNETSKRLIKKITNNSKIEVVYEWVFYEDVLPGVPSINEVFDILPISGVLASGASEDVEFVFYGNVDSKVSGLAVCEVVGGPEYEISLLGESSSVSYRLDKTSLDYGPKDMGSVEQREITLFNTGRVAFEFSVDLKMLSQPVITVSPLVGKLNAGDKQKLTVHLEAKLPSNIKEQFQIAIAYFDPVPVMVTAIGTYPNIISTLPRAPTPEWDRLCSIAEKALKERDPEEPLIQEIPASLLASVPRVELYLEADRVCYMEHATQELREDASRLGRTKSRASPTAKPDGFIISHYVCDFGNVILGQQKKSTFKVTNTSGAPASFDINKRALTGSMFTIEPMQVLRLPPGQTMDFSVQCATNARKHKPETVLIDVPVLVRGGPEVKMTVKANITVPGLEISNTKLDFGAVYVGQRKEMCVQLHNTKEVACEWNIKNLIASSNGKDKDNFECIPMMGSLPPDGRQTVVIAFQPLEKKKMTAKVPFRVAMNPKGQSISCKGTGLTVGLAFEPGNVSLGPVLPYEPSEPVQVKIVNTCAKDIELFSLDFDEQFLQEEDILRGDETYNENRVLHVPPRNPGEALPTFILKAFRKREKKRLKEAELKVEAERKAAEREAAGNSEPSAETEQAPEENVGELVNDADDDEDMSEQVFNVLVTGGPFSGVSTLASALAKQLDIDGNVVTSLDAVIQWALDVQTQLDDFKHEEEEAKRIRESGSKKEKDMLAAKEAEGIEPPSFTEEVLTLTELVKTKLADFRSQGTEPERSSSQKSKRAKKPSPRKKSKDDPGDDSGFADCLDQNVFSEEIITQVIKEFVLQPRYNTGIVFDTLNNSFASLDVTAKCVKDAFDQLGAVRENNLHVLNLGVPREEAVARMASLKEECTHLVEDKEIAATLKKFKVLGDKDVAKLAGDKLAKYEEMLAVYKSREDAMAALVKLEDSENKITAFYGDPASEQSANASAPDAQAAGVTPTKLPPLQFLTILHTFGMEFPHDVSDGKDVVIKSVNEWVKAKQFAPCSIEDMSTKAFEYLKDVFYIAEDPSLADPSWVPPPALYQLVRYPEPRRKRPPAKNFCFVDRKEEMPSLQVAPEVVVETGKKSASRQGKKPAKKEAAPSAVEEVAAAPENEPVEPIITFVPSKQTRWIIPAKGFTTVYVQFQSDRTGRFNHQLSFEIVGSQAQFELDSKGLCTVPEIAQEPRSVFMRRTKSRKPNALVHKQYVISDKIFDFGPLLIGKDPTSRLLPPTDEDKRKVKGKGKKPISAVRRTNGEVFRITNTGMFNLQVDFAFRDAVTSVIAKTEVAEELTAKGKKSNKKKDPPKKGGKKGKKEETKEDTGPVTDPNQPIFIVEPPSLLIPQEEMREITVWSFPQDVSTFSDVLVCSIKDNPMCVQFPVRCEGSKPTVQLSASEIVFDRLLIGQSESKDIEVKNISTVPVMWTLTGIEELGDELSITPATSGVVQPLESAVFNITFKAIEQQEYSYTIPLEVRDTEDILGLVETKPIKIQAEAFKMDAAVELPEKGLDFEILRVNEAAQREFKIVNQGKYNIKYGFSTAARSQALFAEILNIEPNSGVLTPGQEQSIVVTAKTSAEETVKCSDLKLHLIEGGTDEVVQTIPVAVALRSVFSQFRILPVHGVNFGPLELGVTKTKKMQICNDGEFEFLFRLFAAKDRDKFPEPLAEVTEDDPKDKKSKKEKKGKEKKKSARGKGKNDPDGESVVLGPFTVSPTEGSIPPGSTLDIGVLMEATQIESYLEVLEVDISQREYKLPGGHMADGNRLTLDLTGESCSPGVDTTGYESIFEEQAIMNKIGGRVVDKNFFALEEKAFVFAPVIANQKADSARCERFRISNPFKVACNVQLRVYLPGAPDDSSSKPANSGRGAKKAGKKGKKDEAAAGSDLCPFKIDPPALHIPNHEHRYVTVWFNPTALRAYTAIFEATVDKGTDPRTKQLQFELRGEGTLPHLTVSEPANRTEDGFPHLCFDRVFCHPQLNRSQTMPIILYNPGIVPATARFDMDPSDTFAFSGLGKMVVVDPGAEHRLEVVFQPTESGTHEKELKMSILQNPFEVSTFKLVGEGYLEDVALEMNDESTSDELSFGDVPVGNTASKVITLVNYSDYPYRFAWQPFASSATDGAKKAPPKKKGKDESVGETTTQPDFVFSPAVGHVQPHSSKTVNVTFHSAVTRLHDKQPTKCVLDKIRYLTLEERMNLRAKPKAAKKGKPPKGKDAPAEAPPSEEVEIEDYDLSSMEWDDSMKVSKWVDENTVGEKESGKEPKKKKGAEEDSPPKDARLIEVLEIVPEPDIEKVDSSAGGGVSNSQVTKELTTLLSVVCDKAAYECKVKSVNFRPTMMFQTREFKFPIKNTSTINLNYKWCMQRLQHSSRESDVDVANPFTITELQGTISPGHEDEFSVKFSPLDALTYGIDLVAEIENLPEDCEHPLIKLRGIGQRPKCHFELVNSDYLTGNRRQVGLPGPDGTTGPLDPAYRVIEFKSLGIKVRNTRRFYVMNPTNISYAFEWRCEDGPGSNPFRCNTTKGFVESGRKFEMVFEFTPEQDQSVIESFWRFEITDHDINLPVLLVGSVAEPEVRLDRSNVKFEPLMLGRRQTEQVMLVNTEHIPFSFTIDKSSIQSGGIEVKPLSGVIGPEQTLPISLTFMPNREQQYNWNVLFNVRNKPGRVALNVKGEGYAISSKVTLKEEKESNIQRDLFRENINRVDFGAVHIYEKRVKSVIIANEGKFTFNYQWKLPQNRFVTISPMSGTVRAGSKGEVDISYYTATEAAVDNLTAVCTIANSAANKFALAISGRGKKPSLEFSFLQHEFGKCFVNDNNGGGELAPSTKTLKIVNNEQDQNVAVDMTFDSTDFLSVPPTACVLAPGESVEATFKFTPIESQKYRQMVPFEINGLYKVNVLITGEGTPLKLELKDPSQQSVNFGQVRVGGSSSKAVTLVNHSRKTVNFTLCKPTRATPGLLDKALTVYPAYGQEVSLRPRDAIRVELTYEPEARMPAFHSEIMVSAHGVTRRLLELSGACHGVGMRLESDKVPFGNVIEHSSLTRKVKLSNTGDVGSNYKWMELYKPHFSINPSEGFLPAGGNVTMEVTFHPKFLSPDIEYSNVPCLVDGAEMADMFLTLSGGCVEQPKENVEELKFMTKVRQRTTQTVTIANPTEKRWTIRPSIQNEFWTGESTLEVPANGQATYEISFTPLSMTRGAANEESVPDKKSGKKTGKRPPSSKSSGKRPKTSSKDKGDGQTVAKDLGNDANRPPNHEGSLFFPMPNGKAKNYRLVGHATLADPEGTIKCEIAAKSTAIEPLVIKNWLNEYQRFKVIIELENKDDSVAITGADTVDVPGLTERSYKLSFHAFKEGTTKGSVVFLNESTGESLSYSLLFTATSPKVFDNIPKFVTPIQQELVHNISIQNPLATEAVISEFKCEEPTVFVPTPITIPPQSSGTVPVHFRPLMAFESKMVQLTLPSNTLGDFKYQLDLTCSPHVAERSLHFQANLGNELKQTYRFTSYCTSAVEYECKVTGNQFILDVPKVSVAAAQPGSEGVEVAVEILYEPSAVGSERATFTASSALGGSYSCILHGTCEQPKPQGPIGIAAGQTAQVKFKNVLDAAETFNFTVDNASFILAKKTEKLAPKGSISLPVQFKPEDWTGGKKGGDKKGDEKGQPPAVSMAKLLVTCPSKPGLSWVYYIRGTRD